jgi:CheY-like chemotaxis protein
MDEALYVLLISADAADVSLVQRELRHMGYEPIIRIVVNEAQYGRAVCAPETRPDLIIADDGTPELAGLQSLRLLRGWGEDIPYILLTSLLREELGLRALDLGAADYLLKDRVARLGYAALRAIEMQSLKSRLRRVSARQPS